MVCVVCGKDPAKPERPAPLSFRVGEKPYRAWVGDVVCAGHELVPTCATCGADIQHESDPICEGCRTAVDF